MSNVITWEAPAVSDHEQGATTVRVAARAKGICTYELYEGDDGYANNRFKSTKEAERRVNNLIEIAFMDYFRNELCNKPEAEWGNCAEELLAHANKLTEGGLRTGFVYTNIQVDSVVRDEEFKKQYEETLRSIANKEMPQAEESVGETVAVPVEQPASDNASGVSLPDLGGMDIKRIVTIAAVVIILIIGLFIK